MDPNSDPEYDVERWNETRFFGYWSPPANTGLFVHAGRLRRDLDLWWSHLGVFLPDGFVAVDRQWCRNTESRGLVNHNLRWVSLETFQSFECSFDGVCELTSTEALAAGVRGAGAPSLPISWNFTASAHSPAWEVFKQKETDKSWAGNSHTQQTFATTGEITIGGQTLDFSGFAYNDHSVGVRDFRHFGGDDFLVAALPEGGLHTVMVKANHDPSITRYNGHRFPGPDGAGQELTGHVLAPQRDLVMSDRELDLVTTDADGTETALKLEVLGVLPITINDANDNLNGLDWDGESDPVFFAETAVRVTTPDGRVGYGHLERSVRRHLVDRHTFAVAQHQTV
jgi:hypothetical protein